MIKYINELKANKAILIEVLLSEDIWFKPVSPYSADFYQAKAGQKTFDYTN